MLIYGDYDVDGTMAVIILKTAIGTLRGSRRLSRSSPNTRGVTICAMTLLSAPRPQASASSSASTWGIRALPRRDCAAARGRSHRYRSSTCLGLDGGTQGAGGGESQSGWDASIPTNNFAARGVAFKVAQGLMQRRARCEESGANVAIIHESSRDRNHCRCRPAHGREPGVLPGLGLEEAAQGGEPGVEGAA